MENLEFFIIMTGVATVIAFLIVKILLERAVAAKGKITLQLNTRTVKLGDDIQGVVLLLPKKNIQVDTIELTLACHLLIETGGGGSADDEDGTGSDSYTKTIYKVVEEIRSDFDLHKNIDEKAPFIIHMPSNTMSETSEKKLNKHNTKDNQRNIHWSLTAKLRCKGVNLRDDVRLAVPWINNVKTRAA